MLWGGSFLSFLNFRRGKRLRPELIRPCIAKIAEYGRVIIKGSNTPERCFLGGEAALKLGRLDDVLTETGDFPFLDEKGKRKKKTIYVERETNKVTSGETVYLLEVPEVAIP